MAHRGVPRAQATFPLVLGADLHLSCSNYNDLVPGLRWFPPGAVWTREAVKRSFEESVDDASLSQ